ncbi:unnamed protein product [Peronospora destructor]|uniref:CST complex subunit CTC1 n=1 Tax=Peronospora destructor TaxID=86335 RepID=A0AAV0V7Z0_9STRA|nr:unnamed protein product [Peronospora destructor]
MFLEIHDQKLVLLLPIDELYARWTQENVLQVLGSSYQTKDPPMYTGSEPWAASAARLQGGNVNYEVVQSITGNGDMTTVKKHKTRKHVHVVFGRITSVSPISRQKDRGSCHFFVEIESQRSCIGSTTQSTVNVMFTGVHSMRWRLFLHPGKKVLLTDLVKVFSRECEMFLLQTTHKKYAPGHLPATDKGSLETFVMVWNEPESSQMNILKCINASLDFSKENVARCNGKLLDYEGKVCRRLWDECIELQGHDETRVIVSLFHFPYEQELVRVRIGGILRVYGAHVLRWPTPILPCQGDSSSPKQSAQEMVVFG